MEAIQEKTRSQIAAQTRQCYKPFYPMHWHDNIELCQVLDNGMRFLVNGELLEVKAGDVVFIEEKTAHQFLTVYGKVKIRIIQFPPKVLLEAGIHIKRCNVHISANQIREIPGLEQQLNMLLEAVENEGPVNNLESNDYQKCLISAVYCLLSRHFADNKGKKKDSADQREFLRILEYINTHYEENINVLTLAEQLFMYRGRVSTLFRKYSNMSPTEYLYSLRIKKANELIEQGNSIMEAALQSGFQNARTFNRIYKKTLGVTPTEYKKK